MTNDVFIEAVKRNDQRLYVIAFSYLQNKDDAEDVIQNTFLKLWNCNKSFESNEHIADQPGPHQSHEEIYRSHLILFEQCCRQAIEEMA